MSTSKLINFEGERNFRFRLVIATLAGTHIRISKIRSNDMNPGLRDHEVSFLRLLEAVTNGSHIEISYTGTTVIYRPGIIIGGQLTHACSGNKPIGYFLEPLLYLAPFLKKKFSVILKGLTSSDKSKDAGIEAIKWGLIPVMEKFGVREVELHILKRGCPPLGGGEVHFICNSLIAQPLTIHALETPKMSAIRGVAFCARVSPSIVNRVIDSARAVFKPTGIEVNITADVWRGENSGKSPGFGVTLVAESKKGWRIFAEGTGTAGSLPEDLGELVAYQLLDELVKSSCFGRNQLKLALAYMAIGKEDVGRVRIHKAQIDEDFIWVLRDIKLIFGTEAYLKDDADELQEDYMTASIKGSGFTSASKKIA
ncbi:18S rRNA biogenesis protein [Metschnikowia bicuspidata var. bicuspidata NRRL YB-4993]|uniref:18S rRNA biogenesis protein n=1 Tax=Metschnikowia bicuspidata var. bicuspidata NRRL YB-4993 TaxID=869754 RepID=A0A1A0H4Z0_9ASCO|nr:18S rRNA biogenesis protein [Metschnikowia bicuspidata var. bicuspidata NRRL YB-4993]OBA19015.1 18S rRNA biogenesis protein [Metschnikowia bicuspidata var. bicuspidata NRRL YB-4993]